MFRPAFFHRPLSSFFASPLPLKALNLVSTEIRGLTAGHPTFLALFLALFSFYFFGCKKKTSEHLSLSIALSFLISNTCKRRQKQISQPNPCDFSVSNSKKRF